MTGNERYRPHTKSGPADGEVIERAKAAAVDAQFVALYAAAAKRHGWHVRPYRGMPA